MPHAIKQTARKPFVPVMLSLPYRRVEIVIDTEFEFFAVYKNHEISVKVEQDTRGRYNGRNKFYIQVTAPSGCYAYDGWWGDSNATMEQAIAQAMEGACLRTRQHVNA